MQRRILFLCAVVCAWFAVAPAPVCASDAAAIAAFRRGDFETARAEWILVLDDPASPPLGAERARVLYDLGNVAFRAGNALEAIGWYTASLRLRPRDADTWANLEHARNEAKLAPADRGDLAATVHRIVTSFSPGEGAALFLCAGLLWAVALGFEALRGGRLARWLAILGGCAVVAASVPWVYHLIAREGHDPVLMIEKDKALVRSEPRKDAAVIAEVKAGEEAERVDVLVEWTKIEAESGTQGWVLRSGVFSLNR